MGEATKSDPLKAGSCGCRRWGWLLGWWWDDGSINVAPGGQRVGWNRGLEICRSMSPAQSGFPPVWCMYLEMYLDLQLNLYFCKFCTIPVWVQFFISKYRNSWYLRQSTIPALCYSNCRQMSLKTKTILEIYVQMQSISVCNMYVCLTNARVNGKSFVKLNVSTPG